MEHRHFASLIEILNKWLDEQNDEFYLTPKTAEQMANAAAAVLDSIQEAVEIEIETNEAQS
jgi:hypothetical protein